MIPNEEGIFYDEPAAQYHADGVYEVPSLSASLAKLLIDKTPRHAWWNCARLNPRFEPEYKGIWDRGAAVHATLLENGRYVTRVEHDSWRSKAAQELREAIRAEGKLPVLAKDVDEIMLARGCIAPQLDRLEQGNPFKSGKPEVVMRWLETFISPDGRPLSIWCRARLDWFDPLADNAIDLKSTTASADPVQWCRQMMWGMGAPYQAAMYRRGLQRLARIGKVSAYDPDFIFLLVESKPPFGLSLVNVPSDIRQRRGEPTADEKLTAAMTLWHDCLAADDWPGYSPEVHFAEGAKELPQPQWSKPQEDAYDFGGHLSSEDIARGI